MKKTKWKKQSRSLGASILSLILCISMLAGTTFAWFTDTATNTGNRVQMGELKFDLEMYKDAQQSEDGDGYVSIAGGSGDIFSESTGTAVSDISAALILADKADVHRTRVRDANKSRFDIHDRVNYAVEEAKFDIDTENKKVYLKLKIDTNICPVIKYFEIFLDRMLMCKRAASYLDVWFHLEINGAILL